MNVTFNLQLEEEHLNAKGIYEAIHSQLLYELPKLTSYGIELLRLAMKTLVGLRMQLQGQLLSSVLSVSTVRSSFDYLF